MRNIILTTFHYFSEIDCDSSIVGRSSHLRSSHSGSSHLRSSHSGDGQTSSGVSSVSSDLGDCGSTIASCSVSEVIESASNSDGSIAVSSNEKIGNEPPTKKRRIHQKFNLAQKFDNLDDAKNHLVSLKIWSPYYPTKSNDGERPWGRSRRER